MNETIIKFRIGKVVSRSSTIFRLNFIPFIIIALVPIGLLEAFSFLLNMPPDASVKGFPFTFGKVIYELVDIVVNSLVSGAIIHGIILFLRGEAFGMKDSFQTGLLFLLPIAGYSLIFSGFSYLVSFGNSIYILLIFIPLIFFIIVTYVTIPVIVIENKGIWDSMKKSAELTKGSRWDIAIMTLLFIVIIFVPLMLIAFLSMAYDFNILDNDGILSLLFKVILGTTVAVFFTILTTVSYYELCDIKGD